MQVEQTPGVREMTGTGSCVDMQLQCSQGSAGHLFSAGAAATWRAMEATKAMRRVRKAIGVSRCAS
jgi:hypothetical protein